MSTNMIGNKYKLDPDDFIYLTKDQKAYRIIALRDIEAHNVKKGEAGGYLESYNLSHEGDCWVKDKAYVCGGSLVTGNALICDEAGVSDHSCVGGNAVVSGVARVRDGARVNGFARVCDDAVVEGSVLVTDYSVILHKSYLSGTGRGGINVTGYSRIVDSTISGCSILDNCWFENLRLCFPLGSFVRTVRVNDLKNILIISRFTGTLIAIKQDDKIYVCDSYNDRCLVDDLSNPLLVNFIKNNFGE